MKPTKQDCQDCPLCDGPHEETDRRKHNDAAQSLGYPSCRVLMDCRRRGITHEQYVTGASRPI